MGPPDIIPLLGEMQVLDLLWSVFSRILWPIALWTLIWLVPVSGFIYLTYFFVSLPMRRQERARFFLDLVETGLDSGRSVEQGIVAAAQSGDPAMGLRYHMLAACLEAGYRLEQALAQVPGFLPPQITAMLKVGSEIGNIRKVLPACRQLLKDSISQTRGALNYLLVLGFGATPISPVVFIMIGIYVVPKFREIAMDMGVSLPPLTAWVFEHGGQLAMLATILLPFVLVAAACYIGGPRLTSWGNSWLAGFPDHLAMRLPWRRKRLQRDFSTMLALLLDAGLPEERALQLAAASTANAVFISRAGAGVELLRQGAPLSQAVETLDDTGEFRWRLANAGHSQSGFMGALNGWLEALDAKAFQQEQAAAQALTTALVLLNGVLVGAITMGMFFMLIAFIQEGVYW